MKKKNGFTIVEILGVVILIAAISLLVFPAMLEQFRKAKDDINESTLNLIYSGAGTLMGDELQTYPKRNGNAYCISLRSLVDGGYVSDSIKDVINDRDYDLDLASVKASYVNNKFEYDFIQDGSCVSEIASFRTFDTVMSESDQVAALDPESNPRYVGVEPDNYVWFNKELWRIIGLFNGQAKIIRDDYYSTGIEWDDRSDGDYLNDWEKASLNKLLNDKDSSTSYISSIQSNDPVSYKYIDLDHVWNIGAYEEQEAVMEGTRSGWYYAERSTTIAGASGSKANWTGTIGLMYPSDYGYASSGNPTICDEDIMESWYTGNYKTECAEKSWLYDSNNYQWTLTPVSDVWTGVYYIHPYGDVSYGGMLLYSTTNAVSPALYLKSNVGVVDGNGTREDPYILSQ